MPGGRLIHCGDAGTATHQEENQGHLDGHRPSRGCLAGHGLARAARQPAGQRRHPQAGRGSGPRAQLQGRPPRLQPAHTALRHAGPAAVRGPDPGRFAHQSVLPVDARLDHPRLRQAWPRPAGVVPAVVGRLACRLRGQHEGRWPDPARLRRLHRLRQQARAPGRAGHAFRALGRGAAGTAGHLDRLRQRRRRRARGAPPDAARASQDRLPRRCVDPLPGVLRALLRLRCGAARGRPAHEPGLAGRCRQFRAIRLRRRPRADRRVAMRSTRSSPPAT